uniref:Uncharacterized protein n=1 Tax=Panagrolaimus davidi TaxID=227884 RepID=A0A914PIZ3_9BILA
MFLIKFYAINDENEERKTSWFMKEAVQTLKDLKAFGLQRWKIQKTDINFKFYEFQKAGKMIELGEGEDEVAENGCNYVIADVRISKTSIHNALKKKNDSGVTAPAILAVGTYPETISWIAVDGLPLKVHGAFADALQSFMEVTWLFNLKYDPMVLSFV